ncbi:MAG: hypothetical protein OEV12_02430 [Gammaproteobacteria bacterium]|jgi:hypothetical protein|nr:hypothetical protein [Gammaproteobacteria bacterium]MDH3887614.1 hypothetical protein [Gammaproteobacteria bacterium]MDH3933551.1 hypothetical protein [Gammaproteobacteria bacterium]MDH3985254.1 hypothetical protein [Gammaproteobacteria bacterium]
MKSIKLLIACSVLMTSVSAMAANDPEMDYIDMSPDNRVPPPAGMNSATLIEATATVTAVDMERHLVTIQGPQGNIAVIQVTDQVKNLPQVKIGDVVDIQYYRSAIAELVKVDKNTTLDTTVSGAKMTRPEGDKPGGAIGLQVKRRAEVMFVDPIQKFITFLSPDRGLRKISLENSPDLQHYLEELKKGDIVEVTYTEALAISLEPSK